jgi:hypothetical protein
MIHGVSIGRNDTVVNRLSALGQLYQLKENLRVLLTAKTPEEARRGWDRWLDHDEACDHAEGAV